MIRLNKFLASTGIGSRRKCDQFIMAGRIRVNGEVVQKLGVRINEYTDRVSFDDREVSPVQNYKYILLNNSILFHIYLLFLFFDVIIFTYKLSRCFLGKICSLWFLHKRYSI